MVAPYYDDGKVQIWHGDCREILPQLKTGSIDCVVTSPPYNLVRMWVDTNGPNSINKLYARKILEEWYDDDMPEEEYQRQQRWVLEELMRVCDGSVFYNHKVRYAVKRLGRVIHPMEWMQGLPLWAEIIWDRGGGMALNSRRFFAGDERIFQFKRPKAWHQLGLTAVWRVPPAPQGLEHPCPFPLEIPRRCIAATTDPGHIVLDPYMGAGTTLVAAKRMGRRAVGIEAVERYCELAARRIADEVVVNTEVVAQASMFLEVS